MAVVELRGRAMASEVQILTHGGDAPGAAEEAADRALARLGELEAAWSRFRPDSELARLNASAGSPIPVSTDTLTLVDIMVRAWHLTEGLCDASVLPALLAAGYTTSKESDAVGSAGALPDDRPAPGLAGVSIDPRLGTVTLPVGVALDPGGVGKGLAADLVAVEAVLGGVRGALVSVGGDLRAAGHPPDGGWPVEVEAPTPDRHSVLSLQVAAGGVATSSTVSRRWRMGAEEVHHVIDPRTGRSAETDLASVTVIAASGWEAEALASAALIVGASAAYGDLVRTGVGGVLQTHRGATAVTPDLAVAGETWPRPLTPVAGGIS